MVCEGCGGQVHGDDRLCGGCASADRSTLLQKNQETLLSIPGGAVSAPTTPSAKRSGGEAVGRSGPDENRGIAARDRRVGRAVKPEIVREWTAGRIHYGIVVGAAELVKLSDAEALEELRTRLQELASRFESWAESQEADLRMLGTAAQIHYSELMEELRPILSDGWPSVLRDLERREKEAGIRFLEPRARELVTEKVLKGHALRTVRELAANRKLTEADVESIIEKLEREGVAAGLKLGSSRVTAPEELLAVCAGSPELLAPAFKDDDRATDLIVRLRDSLEIPSAEKWVCELRSRFPGAEARAAQVLLWRLHDTSIRLGPSRYGDLEAWVRGVYEGSATTHSIEALRSGLLGLWLVEALDQTSLGERAEGASKQLVDSGSTEAFWRLVFRAEDSISASNLDPRMVRDAKAGIVRENPSFQEASLQLAIAESTLGHRPASLAILEDLRKSADWVIRRLQTLAESSRDESLRRELACQIAILEKQEAMATEALVPGVGSRVVEVQPGGRWLRPAAGAAALIAIAGGGIWYFRGGREGGAASSKQEVGLPAVVTGSPAGRPDASGAPLKPLSPASVDRGSAEAVPTPKKSDEGLVKRQVELARQERVRKLRERLAATTESVTALLAGQTFDDAIRQVNDAEGALAGDPDRSEVATEVRALLVLRGKAQEGRVSSQMSKTLDEERQQRQSAEWKVRLDEIESLIGEKKLPEAIDRAKAILSRTDISDDLRTRAQELKGTAEANFKAILAGTKVTATTKKITEKKN